MVVGGYSYPNNIASFDVELIDLTEQGRTCRKADNFPGAERGSMGAYFDNKALVCGGYSYYDDRNNCYSACYYYNTNGTWTQGPSMIEKRAWAASSFLNNQFRVFGGVNGSILASTELFNSSSNSFVSFVDLPEPRSRHNIISIDDNRVMLLGGEDFEYYQKTFTFNGISWQDGPDLSKGRLICQAGMVTFSNGTRMIVAAGGFNEQITEFLIVDGDKWHYGPKLPYFIYEGASVQLENTFLIVGGSNSTGYLDTIWTFDIETENWIKLNQKLTIARKSTAAFLVPDDFCHMPIS